MKRTEKDVAWSVIAQGFKCLWCGQPAIAIGPDEFMCANDPKCTNAALAVKPEADRLEAEIEKNKNALLRTMNA